MRRAVPRRPHPRENRTSAYSGNMTQILTSPAHAAHAPHKIYVAEIAFVLMLLGGVVVPWAIWWWFHTTPNTVLATADVGQFVAASKGNGATNVQTTTATVAIDGTLSALRGSELVVQRSTKRGTELCVVGTEQSCVALAGSWPGPMRAMPGSERAVDFYAHGISAYTLRIWHVLGFLMAFCSFIAAGAEINQNHPELNPE